MKKCCLPANTDLGILILRFSLGLVFIIHGLAKFQSMDMTIGFFATLGLSSFFAYLVASVEVIGGLLVLLGIYTSYSALSLAIVMIFAILLVKLGKPFIGGYEFDLTLLLSSLALSVMGTGKYKACSCDK